MLKSGYFLGYAFLFNSEGIDMVLNIQSASAPKIIINGKAFYVHIGSKPNKITITILDDSHNPVKKNIFDFEVEMSITVSNDLIDKSEDTSLRQLIKVCLIEAGLCKSLDDAENILKFNSL